VKTAYEVPRQIAMTVKPPKGEAIVIEELPGVCPHLYHRDVERIINAVFDGVADAMARGERVELRGFGTFAVRYRKARMGRYPRNGLPFRSNKVRPLFRAGRGMQRRLNPDETSN
jgi:integration host factor subunit beta